MRIVIGLTFAGLFLTSQAQAALWCSEGAVPNTVIQSLQRDAGKLKADRPRAVDRVHTEGTLPHQGIWDASLQAERDLPLMRDLALIWLRNHDKSALARLKTLLDAWASVYRPSFNPIDETIFDSLIDAYAITQSDLPLATRTKMAALLHTWGAGYIEIMQRRNGSSALWANNWESHRIKLATMAAAALGDAGLFDAARAQFRRQLGQNLRPDGASIDFEERDALRYQEYDVEALVRAAMAARTRGEDWLDMKGENGATLAAALNWLLPYARDEKTHEEFVHSPIAFDAQRAAAGVVGFSGLWNPRSSGLLFWAASTLDARYQPVAQVLTKEASWIAACWPTR